MLASLKERRRKAAEDALAKGYPLPEIPEMHESL